MGKKNSDNFNGAYFEKEVNIRIGDTYTEEIRTKMVFNEKHFKIILDKLNQEFIEKETYLEKKSHSIPERNQEEKNKRHKISEKDYEEFIVKKIIPYKEDMDNFFGNPRNKDSIRIYDRLLTSFNFHLKAYEKKFDNILCFFLEVGSKMKERFRDEIEDYDDDLISLFLCYTYEICDLDKDKGGN
ncbi:MAG: hypothetical protein ACRC18_09110 [Cetobacterium sp.]